MFIRMIQNLGDKICHEIEKQQNLPIRHALGEKFDVKKKQGVGIHSVNPIENGQMGMKNDVE